jgi:hypothetical protein
MKVSNLRTLLVAGFVSFSMNPTLYAVDASIKEKENIQILKENLNAVNNINLLLNTEASINRSYNKDAYELNRDIKDSLIQINKSLMIIIAHLDVISSNQNKNQQIKVSSQPHPMNQLLQKEVNSN